MQILFPEVLLHMKLMTISFILCVCTAVRATPLFNNKPLRDRVPLNVFKYYRLVCQDVRKLVSISVKAISSENNGNENFNVYQLTSGTVGRAGEEVEEEVEEEEKLNYRARDEEVGVGGVDLYVTNKYNGLVAVGRGDSVWRSSDSNSGRVDIHPNDLQVRLMLSNVYMYDCTCITVNIYIISYCIISYQQCFIFLYSYFFIFHCLFLILFLYFFIFSFFIFRINTVGSRWYLYHRSSRTDGHKHI